MFILGIFVFAAGVAIVIKSEAVFKIFGRIEFFEKHLGAEGGSRLGWKLVGMLFIFIGILMMTGLIGGFLGWLTTPLTKFQ